MIRKHVEKGKKGKKGKKMIQEEKKAIIFVGDVVNISDILFTKRRDYLIKYKDNQQVKDKQLAGKVIVLHFVSLVNGQNCWNIYSTDLVDIYNKLEPKGGFEVVLVAVRDDIPCCDTGESTSTYSTHERFEERFSAMPWTAIPFSDLKSRKRLEKMFGIFSDSDVDFMPVSFVIDPRGVVLQADGIPLFSKYGAAGYPFTKERLACLDSEDNVARMQLSVSTLLASPEREYVITNKGDRVPVHKLEDKVVGLLFFTDTANECITWKLKMAYKELSKNMEDFEVVLIYLRSISSDTYENAFWKTFEAMPWLAIPFEDTNCTKKLRRIFKHTIYMSGPYPVSALVIIGPHGEFVEPLGAHILLHYGIPAYPFTRFSAVGASVENIKDVKPWMFWDLDAIFRQQDGTQVHFSQIVGKRIIVIFPFVNDPLEHTLMKLKALYIPMKGTNDEFEVIHICKEGESEVVAAAIPWLMHPPFDKASDTGKVIIRVLGGDYYGLIAFDRDGRVVRTTPFPAVGNMVFPFYADNGDMEDEVLLHVEEALKEPLISVLPCW